MTYTRCWIRSKPRQESAMNSVKTPYRMNIAEWMAERDSRMKEWRETIAVK